MTSSSAFEGQFDLILSNPPYLADPLARLYRHGGGELGSELSVQIVEQGIRRLAPGGRLVLYTGSAIVGGKDEFCDTLRSRLAGRPLHFGYEEIDPDVFGEELEHPPYDRADRIAVVGVTINLRGSLFMSIARAGWARWAGELEGSRFADFQCCVDHLQCAQVSAASPR